MAMIKTIFDAEVHTQHQRLRYARGIGHCAEDRGYYRCLNRGHNSVGMIKQKLKVTAIGNIMEGEVVDMKTEHYSSEIEKTQKIILLGL